MILKLVWENIRFRPIRTLLSTLLIAVPVTLILTLIGLSHGILDDSKRRSQGVGADILVKPPGSSLASFSGATLPQAVVDYVGRQPHVTQTMGMVIQPAGTSPWDYLCGIEIEAFNRMSGGFTFLEGHTFQGPDDALVDEDYAREHHLKAGSKTKVFNHLWTVSGIVEPGKLAHIFVQSSVLQEQIEARGKVSQIYVKVDRPESITPVYESLKQSLDGYTIYPMKKLQELTSVDSYPILKTFINVVEGIGVVIAFAVVSLSMYMAILQRTREIGILKSLGATKAFVMKLILWESFVMGFGGTVAGILLTFAVRAVMSKLVPSSLPVAIVISWWPIAGGIAMGAALLGAIYPGMLAVRQDPIEALAYE